MHACVKRTTSNDEGVTCSGSNCRVPTNGWGGKTNLQGLFDKDIQETTCNRSLFNFDYGRINSNNRKSSYMWLSPYEMPCLAHHARYKLRANASER